MTRLLVFVVGERGWLRAMCCVFGWSFSLVRSVVQITDKLEDPSASEKIAMSSGPACTSDSFFAPHWNPCSYCSNQQPEGPTAVQDAFRCLSVRKKLQVILCHSDVVPPRFELYGLCSWLSGCVKLARASVRVACAGERTHRLSCAAVGAGSHVGTSTPRSA